jgi:hypothetical protein
MRRFLVQLLGTLMGLALYLSNQVKVRLAQGISSMSPGEMAKVSSRVLMAAADLSALYQRVVVALVMEI